jgi:hypothetical protein
MALETVLLSLVSSVVGGLVVAFASHMMTRQRELEKKLVDVRVEHLISCWTKIERAAQIGQDEITAEAKKQRYDDLEVAIARIMLLGDRKEVEETRKFAYEMASGSGVSVNNVLNALRDSLRQQFNLEQVAGMDLFFRMKRD